MLIAELTEVTVTRKPVLEVLRDRGAAVMLSGDDPRYHELVQIEREAKKVHADFLRRSQASADPRVVRALEECLMDEERLLEERVRRLGLKCVKG